jgi:hypothetical protein
MKWTGWEIFRLLLVVSGLLAAGLLLIWGFAWVVLEVEGFFRTHSNNGVLQVIGLVFGVAAVVFIVREQLVMIIMTIKGYSAQQILFGDRWSRMLSVEEKWKERKRKWRQFFGRA